MLRRLSGPVLGCRRRAALTVAWRAGQDSLRSGVVLCKLINRIRPQTIRRINTSQMPFPQRENIKAFCDAARDIGSCAPACL